MSAKDKTMGDTLLLDGILQGTGDVVLPDHLRKALRTIFARQYLVAHGKFDYTLAGAAEFSTAGGFTAKDAKEGQHQNQIHHGGTEPLRKHGETKIKAHRRDASQPRRNQSPFTTEEYEGNPKSKAHRRDR
jgi:hypothetical protein